MAFCKDLKKYIKMFFFLRSLIYIMELKCLNPGFLKYVSSSPLSVRKDFTCLLEKDAFSPLSVRKDGSSPLSVRKDASSPLSVRKRCKNLALKKCEIFLCPILLRTLLIKQFMISFLRENIFTKSVQTSLSFSNLS